MQILIKHYFVKHLIRGIRFTILEIKVLTCLSNNRAEKKIAAILGISYPTVGSYVTYVMGKLNCSSREAIIDFLESLSKISVIRDYYRHLTQESIFICLLPEITKLISGMTSLKLLTFEKLLIDTIATYLLKQI